MKTDSVILVSRGETATGGGGGSCLGGGKGAGGVLSWVPPLGWAGPAVWRVWRGSGLACLYTRPPIGRWHWSWSPLPCRQPAKKRKRSVVYSHTESQWKSNFGLPTPFDVLINCNILNTELGCLILTRDVNNSDSSWSNNRWVHRRRLHRERVPTRFRQESFCTHHL